MGSRPSPATATALATCHTVISPPRASVPPSHPQFPIPSPAGWRRINPRPPPGSGFGDDRSRAAPAGPRIAPSSCQLFMRILDASWEFNARRGNRAPGRQPVNRWGCRRRRWLRCQPPDTPRRQQSQECDRTCCTYIATENALPMPDAGRTWRQWSGRICEQGGPTCPGRGTADFKRNGRNAGPQSRLYGFVGHLWRFHRNGMKFSKVRNHTCSEKIYRHWHQLGIPSDEIPIYKCEPLSEG